MNKISLIIDITNFLITRANTGIQRVLKEFLRKAIRDQRILLHVIYYEKKSKEFFLVDKKKLKLFLNDIKTLDICLIEEREIFTFEMDKTKQVICLEIDRVWNEGFPREKFYPKLHAKGIKIINIIYDLIPLLKPNYFYEQTKVNFPPYMNAILSYSSGVIFNSTNTQKDFEKLNHKHKRFKDIKQSIIPLGCNMSINQKNKSLKYSSILEKKFILFVGTIEPRKKHMFMLQAFEKLHGFFPELNLVFIGAIGWNVETTVRYIEMHPLKGKNFFHFQDVSDSELIRFYQKAFAVCYFSDYEGYGLPVVEALYHKNITFTSKNSSLEEIAQGFVEYVENEKELINKITNYLKNPFEYRKRKQYIKKDVQNCSWIHFYNKILKELYTQTV